MLSRKDKGIRSGIEPTSDATVHYSSCSSTESQVSGMQAHDYDRCMPKSSQNCPVGAVVQHITPAPFVQPDFVLPASRLYSQEFAAHKSLAAPCTPFTLTEDFLLAE